MDQATSSARRGVGAKRQCQDSGDGCFIRYGCGLDYWLCHSFSSKRTLPNFEKSNAQVNPRPRSLVDKKFADRVSGSTRCWATRARSHILLFTTAREATEMPYLFARTLYTFVIYRPAARSHKHGQDDCSPQASPHPRSASQPSPPPGSRPRSADQSGRSSAAGTKRRKNNPAPP